MLHRKKMNGQLLFSDAKKSSSLSLLSKMVYLMILHTRLMFNPLKYERVINYQKMIVKTSEKSKFMQNTFVIVIFHLIIF